MDAFESQIRFNEETRDQWDHYRSHRQKIDELLAGIAGRWFGRMGSLAVLGAGNGNDLELQNLAKRFESIHLFDFDSQALSSLSQRRLGDPKVEDAVVIEPPVDLSGIAGDLQEIEKEQITEAEVIKLADKAKDPGHVLPGRSFDVVVSCCMMTQLFSVVVKTFGDDSEFKHYMMIAMRDGHLKLMSQLLKPGGHGLLVSDFVSSDTLPELATVRSEDAVLALARKAVDERNFFTGANPWSVKDSLAKIINEDPGAPWTITPPWRWQIGDKRSYLVSALQFTKPS